MSRRPLPAPPGLIAGLARAVIALCSAFGAARAGAQASAIDVQIFDAPAGRSSAISIPDPELPAHGTLLLGATANYARQPLVREVPCAADATSIDSTCVVDDGRIAAVTDLAQLELSFAAALYQAVQLGIVLPVGLVRAVDDIARPRRLGTHLGLGDLRLSAELPIARGDTALALSLVAALPTGDGAHLMGARGVGLAPALVLRQRLGATALSLALGYRLRERALLFGLEQDDELDAALGFALPLIPALEARAEVRARLGLGGESVHRNENPVEADLAGLWSPQPGSGVSVLFGAGAGAWPGRAGYGAPALRLFATLRYAVGSAPCAFGPEDEDGYQDHDACRDPDNDSDGIDDDDDACPNDAEDRDGFEDGDGCPDADNDADGLPDTADACPFRSEDRDGFEDDDGCPEPDNDEDLVTDARDACPMDPEDRDGFEDDDGCPEPGPKPIAISVAESRILVSERIYFDYDRDTIRAVSSPVLDQIADVIRGLPAGTRVVVEGHTDGAGNPAYNLDLSHRRARAVVEYLRARGVPDARLDFVGYGGTRPLGPNDSPEGRTLNRRVEFLLLR